MITDKELYYNDVNNQKLIEAHEIKNNQYKMDKGTKEIAKDFAEYLVDKYQYSDNYGIADSTGIKGIDYEMAKKCALFTVEEIENFYDSQFDLEGSKTEAYLNEVKKQIDSL